MFKEGGDAAFIANIYISRHIFVSKVVSLYQKLLSLNCTYHEYILKNLEIKFFFGFCTSDILSIILTLNSFQLTNI